MNKKLILPVLLLGILLPLAVFLTERSSKKEQVPKQSLPPQISKNQIPAVTTLATDLQSPWALAFLPDLSILITERSGTIRYVDSNHHLSESPIATISDVVPPGNIQGLSNESGLLGIAVHPDFKKSPYVYVYYTYKKTQGVTLNRVTRYRYENNTLTERKVLLDEIPGSTRHDGGRIKFGPDSNLYITTGDALNPSHAQDKDSLAGKILRMTMDGKPVPSNPFIKEVSNPEKNEPRTYVYSYGHRNPQGITWDNTHQLWEVEHGDSATDEFNKITPGGNYGWPVIRGNQRRAGMIAPLLQSGTNVWAPSDIAFMNNQFYFGGLKGQRVYQATVTGDTVTLKEYFTREFGRIRDVVTGPDQMIYLLTSNTDGRGNPTKDDDKLIRINPAVFNE